MSKINLVCATDNNFVQHCIIMLVSFARLNNGSQIFILTEGLTIRNKEMIEIELKQYDCFLNIIKVNQELLSQLPMPVGKEFSHISIATYYRLFLSTLLPKSISKVIYMDCDIVVKTKLDNLFLTNITDFAVAAVSQYTGSDNSVRLGINIKYDYFNAGVLLVNLEFWRNHNIEQKFNNYISKNHSKIKYHDQDVLNAVLYDKRLPLIPRYNFLFPFFNKKFIENFIPIFNESNNFKNEIIECLIDSNIVIHYTSSPKPWQKRCVHPLREEYFSISKSTINFRKIKVPSFLFSEIIILINKLKSYILKLIK